MRDMSKPLPVGLPASRGEWHLTEAERELIISFVEEVGSPGIRWLFVHDYDPRVQTTMQPYITFMRQAQKRKKRCQCNVSAGRFLAECPTHGMSGGRCGEG